MRDSSSGINTASLSTSNLAVSHGATVSGFSADGNVVTYTITAPSGTWGAGTQGTYTVSLAANQVKDSAGNAVAANPSLATFTVDTVAPTASLTSAPPAYINATGGNGNTTTLTVTYADSGSGIKAASFSTSNLAVSNGATVTGYSASRQRRNLHDHGPLGYMGRQPAGHVHR